MEKVKDLTKCIIPERSVLVEVIEPKRLIVRPNGEKDADSYAKVIIVHPTIDDIEVGDIILKYGGSLYGYTMKSPISDKERTIAIMHRGNINIAVKPNNFIDPDKLSSSVSV
jgi:hypothetical protein